MSQTLVRNEDFKTTSTFDNVRGIIYRGNGSPTNRVTAPSLGALYIDQYSGQLWTATAVGAPGTWAPYFSSTISNIAIASDVQNGDLVGISGAGAWSAGGSMLIAKSGQAGAGSRSATFVSGGSNAGGAAINTTELFNGSAWSASGVLSISKTSSVATGSQNSGLIAGGQTTALTNATELFDGSTWAVGNVLSLARRNFSGGGTQNAAIVAGGITTGVSALVELFNGATWSIGNSLSIAKRATAAAGSVNATMVTGGNTATATNLTELFNGSSWSRGGVLSVAKYALSGNGAGQNSAWVASGFTTAATNATELFNGSAWSLSGVLSATRFNAGGAGYQNACLITGGAVGATVVATTELHDQTTYRKVNFSNVQNSLNIGIATSVLDTSLTASVMTGDVSGDLIAKNTFFGISRFGSDQNLTFVTGTTSTINSISSTVSNQAVLNLSSTLTGGFAVGSMLKISDGTIIPITGGTALAPIVRWNNVSSSASTSLTVGCVWGQRIKFDPTMTIQAGASSITFNQGPISLTVAYQGKVGDTLVIPYSNISGTTGSSFLYGTYLINNVSLSSSGNLIYSANSLNSALVLTESNIGGAILYQQMTGSTTCLSTEDVLIGYRNKMHLPMNPFNDDFANGVI